MEHATESLVLDQQGAGDTPPVSGHGTVESAADEDEWVRSMEALARVLPPEEVARFSRPRVLPT